jgi:hypothetical protein
VGSATIISRITRAGCNHPSRCMMKASAVPGGRVLTECNNKLYILSANSSEATEVPQLSISLRDALWMPDGHIVCTTNEKPLAAWRLTPDGNIIARTASITGEISYSADGHVTYVADSVNGVHRSMDDGKTWNLVLNLTGGMYHCEQVVQVSSDSNTYDLWTVECSYVEEKLNHTYKHEKFKRSVPLIASKAQQNLNSNHRRVNSGNVRENVTNPTYVHEVVGSHLGRRKPKQNSTYANENRKNSSNESNDEPRLSYNTSYLRIYTMHTHSHALLSQRTIAIS